MDSRVSHGWNQKSLSAGSEAEKLLRMLRLPDIPPMAEPNLGAHDQNILTKNGHVMLR